MPFVKSNSLSRVLFKIAVLKFVELDIKMSVVDTAFSSLGWHAVSSLLKLARNTDIFHHFSQISVKAFVNLYSSATSVKILENFLIFTGKHLYWSLFLIKLQLYLYETSTHVFSCEYCEIV